MGGKLKVTSEVGVGSVFTINFKAMSKVRNLEESKEQSIIQDQKP